MRGSREMGTAASPAELQSEACERQRHCSGHRPADGPLTVSRVSSVSSTHRDISGRNGDVSARNDGINGRDVIGDSGFVGNRDNVRSVLKQRREYGL